MDRDLLVVRLIDGPQFYYLQEFIKLECHRTDDFSGEQAGVSGWVTEDCKALFNK